MYLIDIVGFYGIKGLTDMADMSHFRWYWMFEISRWKLLEHTKLCPPYHDSRQSLFIATKRQSIWMQLRRMQNFQESSSVVTVYVKSICYHGRDRDAAYSRIEGFSRRRRNRIWQRIRISDVLFGQGPSKKTRLPCQELGRLSIEGNEALWHWITDSEFS